MLNECIKCSNASFNVEKQHALLKKNKQDQTYILQTQPQWQKHAAIDPKLIYAWFFERNINLSVLSENTNSEYKTYNIKLECYAQNQNTTIEILKNLPFGNFLFYEINAKGKKITITGSITFSNMLPPQKLQLNNNIDDIVLKLQGIIKTQNNWQICLNGIWISKHDKIPWSIKIIDVQYNQIKIIWNSFGKEKMNIVQLGHEIKLEHDCKF